MTDFIISLALEDTSILVGLAGLALVIAFYGVVLLRKGARTTTLSLDPDYTLLRDVGPAVYRHVSGHAWDATGFYAAVLNLAAKGALSIVEFENGRFKLIKNAADNTKANLSPGEATAVKALFGAGSSQSHVLRAEHHAMTDIMRTCLQCSAKEDFETLYFTSNKTALSCGTALSALALAAMAAVSVHGLAVGMFAIATAMLGFAVYPFALGAWSSWRRGEGAVISFALGLAAFTGIMTLFSGTLSDAIRAWIADAPLPEMALTLFVVCTNMMFYHALKSPIRLGREMLNHVEALRLCLRGSEEDCATSKSWTLLTADVFERLLPYAIALRVEQDWAKQFERAQHRNGKEANVRAYEPSWFHSTYRSWPTPLSFVTGFMPIFDKCLVDAVYPPGHKPDQK